MRHDRSPSDESPAPVFRGPAELHPSAQRVAAWAAERSLTLEIREYAQDGARTAEDAANAVGCQVDQIVKSMVFNLSTETGDELVLALTAGSNRVDPDGLAALAGAVRCGRADPEQVRSITGYAIGGVPPFGHANQLRTWIDPHLLDFDLVWAAAGTPRHVFAIAPGTLLELTGAVEARFTAG
ncbi:MAG: YbaK/EbsC family protein [Acidimicrobiales bacterium]